MKSESYALISLEASYSYPPVLTPQPLKRSRHIVLPGRHAGVDVSSTSGVVGSMSCSCGAGKAVESDMKASPRNARAVIICYAIVVRRGSDGKIA
jgi:hypothetical protein